MFEFEFSIFLRVQNPYSLAGQSKMVKMLNYINPHNSNGKWKVMRNELHCGIIPYSVQCVLVHILANVIGHPGVICKICYLQV